MDNTAEKKIVIIYVLYTNSFQLGRNILKNEMQDLYKILWWIAYNTWGVLRGCICCWLKKVRGSGRSITYCLDFMDWIMD